MRLFFTLILATVFGSFCIAAEEAADGRGAGFTFAKKIITPSLKNPNSADFSWESVAVEWKKTARDNADDDPYQIVAVSGVVRATNSFNAVVPQKWGVIMTYKKELWEPAVVTLDDKVVFVNEVGKRFMDNLDKKAAQKRQEADGRYMKSLQEMEDKAKRERRLEQAFDAGKSAADEAIKRNKWNSKVAASNVKKAAKQAAEKSDFASDESEKAKFLEGFESYVSTAKSR
jgi:hypothetical protein